MLLLFSIMTFSLTGFGGTTNGQEDEYSLVGAWQVVGVSVRESVQEPLTEEEFINRERLAIEWFENTVLIYEFFYDGTGLQRWATQGRLSTNEFVWNRYDGELTLLWYLGNGNFDENSEILTYTIYGSQLTFVDSENGMLVLELNLVECHPIGEWQLVYLAILESYAEGLSEEELLDFEEEIEYLLNEVDITFSFLSNGTVRVKQYNGRRDIEKFSWVSGIGIIFLDNQYAFSYSIMDSYLSIIHTDEGLYMRFVFVEPSHVVVGAWELVEMTLEDEVSETLGITMEFFNDGSARLLDTAFGYASSLNWIRFDDTSGFLTLGNVLMWGGLFSRFMIDDYYLTVIHGGADELVMVFRRL